MLTGKPASPLRDLSSRQGDSLGTCQVEEVLEDSCHKWAETGERKFADREAAGSQAARWVTRMGGKTGHPQRLIAAGGPRTRRHLRISTKRAPTQSFRSQGSSLVTSDSITFLGNDWISADPSIHPNQSRDSCCRVATAPLVLSDGAPNVNYRGQFSVV